MKKVSRWFKGLSNVKKVLVGFGLFFLLMIGASGASHPANTHPAATHKAASSSNTSHITQKTVTETQVIPFTSTTTNDATLAKGTTKITTAGVNGSKTLTYKVSYNNGKQTAKTLVKTEITQQPVAQVTAVGTYVAPLQPSCPNGTYVNSAGNTVCSPYASSSVPAGATAQCADGSYSFSQSRSGTCSHHGGVASWL